MHPEPKKGVMNSRCNRRLASNIMLLLIIVHKIDDCKFIERIIGPSWQSCAWQSCATWSVGIWGGLVRELHRELGDGIDRVSRGLNLSKSISEEQMNETSKRLAKTGIRFILKLPAVDIHKCKVCEIGNLIHLEELQMDIYHPPPAKLA